MHKNKPDKIDLSVNPITGFPAEGKRYYYTRNEQLDEPDCDNPDEIADASPIAKLESFDEARVSMLLERLRWKGARKIRGYRFRGTIPEPKHTTDYLPWLKGE